MALFPQYGISEQFDVSSSAHEGLHASVPVSNHCVVHVSPLKSVPSHISVHSTASFPQTGAAGHAESAGEQIRLPLISKPVVQSVSKQSQALPVFTILLYSVLVYANHHVPGGVPVGP